MIVRFDDVSTRCNMDELHTMTMFVREQWRAEIWWCVSVLTHSDAGGERVFPARFKALSNQLCFYYVDAIGNPGVPYYVKVCSHGLLHLDHRLLGYEAQEISIVTSCSLLKTEVFVPPFNKWNRTTEAVCDEHGIELVKFEDGWRSIEHEPCDPGHKLWYLHHRNVDIKELTEWKQK